ncbi:O-antigen ligase family protein [Flagellimonas onchidii]|uniref:O-antigen ligase family protein n=1 Tax=Flagellimonas onchidii TaxID=2562684 RepID=UPI0010A6315B|nr:O-antigen ligase family protein [Allomuricauda onchidii]
MILVLLFFLYKYLIKKKKQIRFQIVKAITLLSFFLFILNILSFLYFKMSLTNVGFSKLVNFKNLYTPIGHLNNLWASVLILLLAHNTIQSYREVELKYKLFTFLILSLNVFCIFVSFSRGVYISLSLFVILSGYLGFKNCKKAPLVFSVFIVSVVIFLIPVTRDSVTTTFAFNKTSSQQRSTSGRIDRWEHSFQFVKDKPISGWGNGNFILARDTRPFVAEDSAFSSKTDNTYLQLLIEKGILGFVAYLSLFVICALIISRGIRNKNRTKKEKLELTLIFSGLVVFLVRDLTFSSLFSDNAVYLLFFHLVFLLIPYDIELKKIKLSKPLNAGLLTIVLGMALCIAHIHIRSTKLNKSNNLFVDLYKKEEKLTANNSLNKALEIEPNNIVLNKHKAFILSKKALQMKLSCRHPNILEFNVLEKDTLSLSKKYLMTVLRSNPFDDESLHNMGWIHLALNQKDSSEMYFKKSLELNPYNSTYRISKILFDLQNNNHTNIKSNLSKVLRYSPDVLESPFYKEISHKYPETALSAKKEAIEGLKQVIEQDNNPILKARLARLLLKENPENSRKLLREVTAELPNLYRAWTYLAYLEENRDTSVAKNLYKKAIFLSNGDFLPKLYQARFIGKLGNDENSIILLYKDALHAYGYVTSSSYEKNRVLSGLRTITNTYIPNDLLYYAAPSIPHQEIFKYFIDYYGKVDDTISRNFYQNLHEKYNTQLFNGHERLR